MEYLLDSQTFRQPLFFLDPLDLRSSIRPTGAHLAPFRPLDTPHFTLVYLYSTKFKVLICDWLIDFD